MIPTKGRRFVHYPGVCVARICANIFQILERTIISCKNRLISQAGRSRGSGLLFFPRAEVLGQKGPRAFGHRSGGLRAFGVVAFFFRFLSLG